MKNILNIVCLLLASVVFGQRSRDITPLNSNWHFSKNGHLKEFDWQQVNLPHTWNVADVLDDTPGYYRGIGWYKKNITVSKELKGKVVSLFFEGANQETEVFVNGRKAGSHIGGYNRFSIPITHLLEYGATNEVLVKVDNSHNDDIAPLSADFSFYGGIYRDVYLVAANAVHFSTNDNGSNGVYITTPYVSDRKASVEINSIITNESSKAKKLKVVTVVYNDKQKKVAEVASDITLPANGEATLKQSIASIIHPNLWSPARPYLYRVTSKIIDAGGVVVDEISNPLGFRWFSFDADKGFFLNGKPFKLIGASRHQDYEGLGNAVPDSLAVKDVVLLKQMGANFLRVAHYPQDPCVLRACDSLGLLASVEIPLVNEITESEKFYRNAETMQREMIRQNYNHPSVIMWCYMNEILLRARYPEDTAKRKAYYNNVRLLAQRLEDLTRKEDPYRYTMMANHGNLEQYKTAGLLSIPQVVGWNLYSGWYGGNMKEFPTFLDDFHRNYPSTPFLVSEYGADADPRIRTSRPIRFDKSVEYTTRFHQFYLAEMMKRSFVAGAMVWNLADFNSETRNETMPHMNNKGLMKFDRTPKDPYYLYQALLLKDPFTKILGDVSRFGIADSTSTVCYQVVQAASNLDSLTLTLNSQQHFTAVVADGIAEWKVPFREGLNSIKVSGKRNAVVYSDELLANVHLQPHCLTDSSIAFSKMNVVLGTTRYFIDEKGEWWQPDQSYEDGEWGYVGGAPYRIKTNAWLPYGTDKNIIGTCDDPIYQTQQTGIKQYKLKVPTGKYQLSLHFAELAGGGKISVPPYNLIDTNRVEERKKRIFHVNVNGRSLLHHFNIADDYGVVTPVIKTTTVVVDNADGITIDFVPVEGEPVLNALQIKKLD